MAWGVLNEFTPLRRELAISKLERLPDVDAVDRAKRTRPSRHAGQEVAETSSICVTFFLLSSASPHGVTKSVQYGTCTESECQTWFPARPSASDAGLIPYEHPLPRAASPATLVRCDQRYGAPEEQNEALSEGHVEQLTGA